MNMKLLSVVKPSSINHILRQEKEDKFWFIISCTFLTPVTGIKIDSEADMSLHVCHYYIQEDNNNNERLNFQSDQKEGPEGHEIEITGRKQAQTTKAIV